MKFSERWLRSFADPSLSTAELAHALTMAGLEVESLEPAAPPFSKVVVGEILEVARHPNADRLSLCQVNVGEPAPLAIVCGAPNVAAGMRVPCALVGARLTGADGKVFEIKRSSLRGVDSQGMLCSAQELGIDDDHSGILPLAADAPIGGDVRELLELDDTVFTLKLTPNRADCLSLLGVAREVAAITGAAFKAPAIAPVAAKSDCAIPGEDFGCGRLRTLHRPRDPQCRRRRARARVDEAAPRALRPALDFGAGGRDQLRDAGAWTPAARLRPGQARRRHRRALRAQGRAAEAAERADRRCGRGRAVHHRWLRPDRARRHHGRRFDQSRNRQQEYFPRIRVLLSRGDRGPHAPLQFHQRRRASLRARR